MSRPSFLYGPSFSSPAARRLTLGLCAALSLAVAACGDNPAKTHPDAGDRVVARVEKHEIWASDVRREAVAQGLIGEGEPLDVSSELFRRVLDEVIDQTLLAREAERRGLADSPAAQRRLEAVRQRILGDMLVETVVNKAVSNEAVERLYAEQQRRAQKSEEVRLRLILTETREQADAVVALIGQGTAFEAVAAQRSVDQASRALGGDLGYATPDLLPAAYAAAVADKPAGALVGPVEYDGRWAVLRVEDRRAETPPTLEQARPVIVRYLTYEGVRQLLEQLRGKAKVEFEIDPPRSAPQTPPPASASAPAGSNPATAPATASVSTKSSSGSAA
ncbi:MULTISPECIES: peptidylprolyl isomerase [unclassified Brevundimonas]|uniref:peptidylprolyl isomerase n=1 Tax=unclassified Brevundimonas TaxID=2622653 RepID=UPI0025BD3936|nr:MULTISPECIES: peptidylprolyl isomerase [unclassified Brevundimonas]